MDLIARNDEGRYLRDQEVRLQDAHKPVRMRALPFCESAAHLCRQRPVSLLPAPQIYVSPQGDSDSVALRLAHARRLVRRCTAQNAVSFCCTS